MTTLPQSSMTLILPHYPQWWHQLHCMIEHMITSKIQESMHRMVEHLKDKNSNKNYYNITQPSTQLKMQMWTPSQIQTTAHKTTVHQPPPNTKYNLQKHSNKTNRAFLKNRMNSNILQNNATNPTVWPVPNWTLSTIELNGQHIKPPQQRTTVYGERFTELNFCIFHGFQERRESFSMNISASL